MTSEAAGAFFSEAPSRFQLYLVRSLFASLLVLYSFFYALSLSIPETTSSSRYQLGDDFEYEAMLKQGIADAGNATDIRKHPLFLPVASALYRLTAFLSKFFAVPEQVRIVLPFAFLGLLNLLLGYFIFRRLFGDNHLNLEARLLTLIYGASFSFWMAHANVETYALSLLSFSLLLAYLAVFMPQGRMHPLWLGFFAGLCLLSSLALGLTLVLVLSCLYVQHKAPAAFRRSLVRMLLPAILMCLAVYSVYGITLKNTAAFTPGGMLQFACEYLHYHLGVSRQDMLHALSAFHIHNLVYADIEGNPFLRSILTGLILLLIYLSIRGFIRHRDTIPALVWCLLIYHVTMLIFFLFFRSEKALLYSSLFLPGWLILLYSGLFRLGQSPIRIAILASFLGLTLAGNAWAYHYVLNTHNFTLKEHYGLHFQKTSLPKSLKE